MAHELGHGAFTLKHTFDEYTTLPQSSTDNLMDYGSGTNLWKTQWDRIHDPATVLGLFESDAAGELVGNNADYVKTVLNAVREAYGKSKNLVLDARSKNEFNAQVTLGNGKSYSLILLFEKTNAINSPVLSNDQNYTPAATQKPMKGIAIYSDKDFPSQPNRILSILFDPSENKNTDDDIKSLSEYLFQQTTVNKKSKIEPILIKGIPWVSQFDESIFGSEGCFCKPKPDGTCKNVCCATACKYILKQLGLTIQSGYCIAKKAAENDYNSVLPDGNFEKALLVLEKSIKPKEKGGEPILIGVHYPKDKYPGYQNTCAPTFHYMLVVGSGYDEQRKQNYFRFYDVGVRNENTGTSEFNRLYVDKANKTISGTYNDRLYTVTEVRPNH